MSDSNDKKLNDPLTNNILVALKYYIWGNILWAFQGVIPQSIYNLTGDFEEFFYFLVNAAVAILFFLAAKKISSLIKS